MNWIHHYEMLFFIPDNFPCIEIYGLKLIYLSYFILISDSMVYISPSIYF